MLLVPLICRYFEKHLSPQKYIGIGLLSSAIIILLFSRKFSKVFELLSFVYLTTILIIYTINVRLLLHKVKSDEAFYMGYAFALFHRMLDYRLVNFKVLLVYNVCAMIVKFSVVPIPVPALVALVVLLEISPMILSFKAEHIDRLLFDSVYKSRNQLFRFKDFVTKYLPNQMLILSKDYSTSHFVNDAFQRSFKCDESFNQVKEALKSLVIERDDVKKNEDVLTKLGYKQDSEGGSFLTVSHFFELLSKNMRIMDAIKLISFQVFEDKKLRAKNNLKVDEINIIPVQGDGLDVVPSTEENILKTEMTTSKRKVTSKHTVTTLNHQKKPKHLDIRALEDEEQEMREDENDDSRILDSSTRMFKLNVVTLPWGDHEAIALVLDDVTHERTIMELKIADKNKDLVIATVSHELRTPLNGMLGLMDMIKAKLMQFNVIMRSDVLLNLETCKNSSLLLLNLVNSILDFSQIKNNKIKLIETEVSIASILDFIKPLFEPFCKLRQLWFKIVIDDNVPNKIVTDRNRLSQILINLLGNAFKFTFVGGVTIKVVLVEKCPYLLRFSIEDTGIGIKEVDHQKLFKLFGRIEQQDNKVNTQGVGLGLTISNQLAMLLSSFNKNEIQVTSEYGKGSIFSFLVEDKKKKKERLDAVNLDLDSECGDIEEQVEELRVTQKLSLYADSGESHEGLLIMKQNTFIGPDIYRKNSIIENPYDFWCLIVDDNPFNLMVASSLMEERGYKIVLAMNGKEAIEKTKLQEQNESFFKVILMDCQMPVMNGYEATRILTKMMKEREINQCPIIALTANNRDEEHENLCLEVGMSGTIAKPLKIEELEAKLKDFCKVDDY